MKSIRTEQAVGHVLCHDITQIIKDEKRMLYLKRAILFERKIYRYYSL